MVGLERGIVKLEPYKKEWTELYKEEVQRLKDISGNWFCDFDHIGSTAIEGMPAKPILDILTVVEDLDEAKDLISIQNFFWSRELINRHLRGMH